jgi:hypothetical protein
MFLNLDIVPVAAAADAEVRVLAAFIHFILAKVLAHLYHPPGIRPVNRAKTPKIWIFSENLIKMYIALHIL